MGEARRKPNVPGSCCSRRAKISQSLPKDLVKPLEEARRRFVDKKMMFWRLSGDVGSTKVVF